MCGSDCGFGASVLELVNKKSNEAEQVVKEVKEWVDKCTKNIENINSFGAVIVSKDGSVDTYHEILDSKHNLALAGGLEALKHQLINKHFDFDDS